MVALTPVAEPRSLQRSAVLLVAPPLTPCKTAASKLVVEGAVVVARRQRRLRMRAVFVVGQGGSASTVASALDAEHRHHGVVAAVGVAEAVANADPSMRQPIRRVEAKAAPLHKAGSVDSDLGFLVVGPFSFVKQLF